MRALGPVGFTPLNQIGSGLNVAYFEFFDDLVGQTMEDLYADPDTDISLQCPNDLEEVK